MTQAEIEQKLRRIGARRKRHSNEGEAIQGEVAEVVSEARGVVPMERVADLLGMHRSSIYELYIGGSSDDDDGGGPAPRRAEKGKSGPKGAKGPEATATTGTSVT